MRFNDVPQMQSYRKGVGSMRTQNQALLIVEDDKGLQKQLKWHFSESEYEVLLAEDYDSAIDVGI